MAGFSDDDRQLLEELILARGPGGQEDEVRDICRRELAPCCDDVWEDTGGNLIGVIRAPGERAKAEAASIRILAHMDEIAMVVKRVAPDGSLRVLAQGGAFPMNFGMCPVEILAEDGILPGVLSYGSMHGAAESPQMPDLLQGRLKWQDVHVATRLSKDDLAARGVHAGTRVVLSRQWRRPFALHDCIAGHFMDDRAPLLATLRTAALLAQRRGELACDALFVCTTKEEETNAGALYAARTLPGETSIAVEVGPVADEYDTKLTADPIVLFGDEKGYYTRGVSDALMKAVRRAGATPQPALMPGFASDASAILHAGAGGAAGCLAIPTANTHGYEMIVRDGITACARSLADYVLNAGTWD